VAIVARPSITAKTKCVLVFTWNNIVSPMAPWKELGRDRQATSLWITAIACEVGWLHFSRRVGKSKACENKSIVGLSKIELAF